MNFTASRFFSFPSPTKMLMPDSLHLEGDRACIIKRRLFGISSTNEQVLFTRIASVRVDVKIFTAEVVIETGGGATEDLSIGRMMRSEARRAANELRRLAWFAVPPINPVSRTYIPAGWYDNGSGRQQWWDGYQWNDVYQDATQDTA